MENNKIRVAITQGDNNGVGHELILKTFAEQEMFELCTPIIYGSAKTFAEQNKALGLNVHLNIVDCDNNALDKALGDYRQGQFDVLVIGPMTKNPLKNEYFKNAKPIYLNEQTRIVVLSNSNNPADTAKDITEENITAKTTALRTILKRDFRLSNPRIAIMAYNPEANGKEETEVMTPAISKMVEEFIPVYGPYRADSFFENGEHTAFDGIIAINHDQRLKASRLLSETNDIVSVSGLDLSCAMLINNTGQKTDDGSELRQAIYHAIDTYRFRREYDAPMGNPLPKLYHERPDSGEKLRFSIPKKAEGRKEGE